MMEFTISTDKEKLDIAQIHDYLSHHSYWAMERSLEEVKTSIENSICFGLYDNEGQMIGFARVLTDRLILAYVMDVFILESYRGNGLGHYLLDHILFHSGIQVKSWMLETADAHSLYEKYGFHILDSGNRYMIRKTVTVPESNTLSSFASVEQA